MGREHTGRRRRCVDARWFPGDGGDRRALRLEGSDHRYFRAEKSRSRSDMLQFGFRVGSRRAWTWVLPTHRVNFRAVLTACGPAMRQQLADLGTVFSREARDAIQIFASASRGIPRVINALCDNVLVLIYGAGDSTATATHARQVVRDLDLCEGEVRTVAPGRKTDSKNGASNGAHLNLPDPAPLAASKQTGGFRVRLRIRR